MPSWYSAYLYVLAAHGLDAHTDTGMLAVSSGTVPDASNCSAASLTSPAYWMAPLNTVMSNSSNPSPSGEKLTASGLTTAVAPLRQRLRQVVPDAQ